MSTQLFIYHYVWLLTSISSLLLQLEVTSYLAHRRESCVNQKKNLIVILTMKANGKSYPNEKNVRDGWRKTQRIDVPGLNHVRTPTRNSTWLYDIHVGDGFPMISKLTWSHHTLYGKLREIIPVSRRMAIWRSTRATEECWVPDMCIGNK